VTVQTADLTRHLENSQPRAVGSVSIRSKVANGKSCIDELRQSGCMRALFPQLEGMSATLINTAGGVTGGDRLSVRAVAGEDSFLTITTQAAERAYRAKGDTKGSVCNQLRVERGGTLHWLPQELILFEGSRFDRRLRVELAKDASLLMVEPIVFGRRAMHEELNNVVLSDQILIRREGTPIYIDGIQLKGDFEAQLEQPAIANSACAVASVVMVHKDAERWLKPCRALLPKTAGASLLAADILSLRFLAADSFLLRKSLVPVLQLLRGSALPTSWRL